MPNWVKTQVYARTNDKCAEMAALLKGKNAYGEDREVTLNAIIPMPEDVYREPVGADAPANNWYNWCVSNWGTKWDVRGDSVHIGHNYIEFETAWSFPLPVMVELAKRLGETILCMYADEGIPENSGILLIDKDGECGFLDKDYIINHVIWEGGCFDIEMLFEQEDYIDFEDSEGVNY